jgi:hypothetical protein
MGFISGYLIAILSAVYATVLAIGLLSLPTPEQPIQNPWFTIMELLILVLAPVMVGFTTSLHAWVPPARKPVALLGIVFMGMCAVVTGSVHFSVLTLSRLENMNIRNIGIVGYVILFPWGTVLFAQKCQHSLP